MATNENNGVDESETDAPDFSRADARRRREAEGIADEVYDFRVKTRKRLKSEGMTKKQAGEKMWELALEKFPSPEDAHWAKLREAIEASDVMRKRGETLPAGVESIRVDGLAFKDIWIVFHVAVASRFYLDQSLTLPALPDEDESEWTEWGLCREYANLLRGSVKSEMPGFLPSPSAATKAVVSLAADDFPVFLAITERMFQVAVEHLETADGASDDALDLLEKATDELVALQVPIAPATAESSTAVAT